MKTTFLICFLALFSLVFYPLQGQQIKEALFSSNKSYRYLSFDTSKGGYSPKQSDEIFRNLLKSSIDVSFSLYENNTDDYGFTHEKYQQYYKGIKVEHAVYFIHSKNNVVEYINGDYRLINLTSVSPKLTEKEALSLVLKKIGAKQYAWENEQSEKFVKELSNDDKASYFPKGELVICKNYDLAEKNQIDEHHLCYKFNITAIKPDLHETIYIDAETGNIIVRHSETCSILGDVATRYNGTQNVASYTSRRTDGKYILQGNGVRTRDLLNGSDISAAIDFADNNNEWTAAEYNNARKDNAALSAHWAATLSKKYWFEVHGRRSYDNQDSEIQLYVHAGNNYNDAGWQSISATLGYLFLGDGDGINYNPFVSIDAVSHEIGHAVSQSCNINKFNTESSEINEALSDIWAVCIENRYAPKKVWHIGEDIVNVLIGTEKALRVISSPKSSLHADTYGGTYWNDDIPVGTIQYKRSTIISYWFYMICQGKTGINDYNKSYVVKAIGMDAAEKIVYNAIRYHTNTIPSFDEFVTSTLKSAKNMYGDCSQEAESVANAWYAVGLSQQRPAFVPIIPTFTGSLQTCNFVIKALSTGAESYTWTIPQLGISNLTTSDSSFSVPYASWVGFSQISVTCVVSRLGCTRSNTKVFNRPTFPTSPPCNMRLANPSIKTYPNPTDDLLNIELINLNSPVQNIMLINSLGNEVLREEKISLDFENTSTLSLKNLPDGIYYLTLSLEDGRQFSQKVVLQKGKIAN